MVEDKNALRATRFHCHYAVALGALLSLAKLGNAPGAGLIAEDFPMSMIEQMESLVDGGRSFEIWSSGPHYKCRCADRPMNGLVRGPVFLEDAGTMEAVIGQIHARVLDFEAKSKGRSNCR